MLPSPGGGAPKRHLEDLRCQAGRPLIGMLLDVLQNSNLGRGSGNPYHALPDNSCSLLRVDVIATPKRR
jgi:hypothetical protein